MGNTGTTCLIQGERYKPEGPDPFFSINSGGECSRIVTAGSKVIYPGDYQSLVLFVATSPFFSVLDRCSQRTCRSDVLSFEDQGVSGFPNVPEDDEHHVHVDLCREVDGTPNCPWQLLITVKQIDIESIPHSHCPGASNEDVVSCFQDAVAAGQESSSALMFFQNKLARELILSKCTSQPTNFSFPGSLHPQMSCVPGRMASFA